MFGSNDFHIIATLIMLFIHLLQGLYLKFQLRRAEEEYGEILAEDQKTAFRLKFLRDPYLMGASYALLTAGVLLICLVSGPVAVGFSAYAVVTWRPLRFEDVAE